MIITKNMENFIFLQKYNKVFLENSSFFSITYADKIIRSLQIDFPEFSRSSPILEITTSNHLLYVPQLLSTDISHHPLS